MRTVDFCADGLVRHARRALATTLFAGLTAVLTGCSCCNWSLCDRWVARQYNSDGIGVYSLGQYSTAQTLFQEAAVRNPQNPDIYYNLAASYHRQGDLGKAEYYYNQCLDHDPGHRKCYHALAVALLEQGRHDDAISLMEGWQDEMPYSPEAAVELAWVQRQTGDLETAQAQLQHALEISPRHPEATAALGEVYELQGRNDRALAMYGRSLRSNNPQPLVAGRMAYLRAANAQPGAATDARVAQARQGISRF